MNKKQPRQHQSEAVDCIVKELETKNRATAVMACGTGKTLVALWAAEKMGAKTILVLLPSLALVKQTFNDWSEENTWKSFRYLCACSDKTVVEEDEIKMTPEELGFAVTTNSAMVKEFLSNSGNGTSVIFSTYQSCDVVISGIPDGFSFDLGVFDEAHKTSGPKSGGFSLALEDSNISIRKRLFMTATPRHYRAIRSKTENDTVVFSMDNKDVYGDICYKLSFREAIERDLICDYKIIVSIVTSDMVNREILQNGRVSVDNTLLSSRHIANLLSLKEAVELSGSKKIISFHSSVKKAQEFVSYEAQDYVPGFNTFHINGLMNARDRGDILSKFKTDDKTLISNARCLTEGIDVPAVDMIAFLDPKKSKIDIIQAIGRAMRKSPGKSIGYIFIPLFLQLNAGETLEQALNTTDYAMLFDIIQSMKEQDAELSKNINAMRLHDSDEYEIPQEVKNKFQFYGPTIFLHQIVKSITTKFIESAHLTFDEYFEQLVAYKEKHGHCRIPESHYGLGAWVHARRKSYRVGEESTNRITKMESVGFEYVPFTSRWEVRIELLKKFKEEHGHCNVPRSDKYLGTWINTVRTEYKKNILSQDRIDQLEQLGFLWRSIESLHKNQWQKGFNDYQKFIEKYGKHPATKNDSSALEIKMAGWARKQRLAYRRGEMSPYRIDKLKGINFDFIGARNA